jgi:hypothetical protein
VILGGQRVGATTIVLRAGGVTAIVDSRLSEGGGAVSQDVPRELQAVGRGNGAGPQSPAEIERQIELARSQLAATIDALAIRMSPKQVAQRNVHRVRQVFSGEGGGPSAVKVGGLTAGVVLVAALLVWRRRSR